MKEHRQDTAIPQTKDLFVQGLGQKGVSVPCGMYHLIFQGLWTVSYVSGGCLEMLGCAEDSFLDVLRSSIVYMGEGEVRTQVGDILDLLSREPGEQFYSGIAQHGSGAVRRIKSSLSSVREGDGLLHLYGQVLDITQPHDEIALFSTLMNEYQAGLERHGRMIFRYSIQSRQAVIPPEIAEQQSMPQVIEDLPRRNVESGHIAPESVEAWYSLFDAIDRGDKYGVREIIFLRDGGKVRQRCRVEFSGITGKDGAPVAALVSYEDITEQYEHERIQALDRDGLLRAAQMTFPEILSVNLTKGTYRMIQYYGATTLGTPKEGPLEQMLLPRLENVAPEDQEPFREAFFPEGQLRAIREGRERIALTYRRRGPDGVWHWMETIAMPQANPYDDDILTFAVSRSVDEEKHREGQLNERIRQQAEELRITMEQMGNHISYYDVATKTLTTLPQTAKTFGVPMVMEDYPESFIQNAPAGYPVQTGETLRDFVAAIHRGDPSGSCDYPTVTATGERVWLRREFATIFDEQGVPVRAVISSEDVTERYEHEHQQEVDRGGLLRVAQLVFPEILSCNLTQDTCEVVQSIMDVPQNIPLDEFILSRLADVAPEDQEGFKKQFFRENQLAAMEKGRERFQFTYRRRGADGVWHWIETTSLRHRSPYSDDVLTFAVSRNVDQQKAQEELLRQALAESTDKLEGWLYYNSLSSQSFPGLVYVNYDDGRASPYSVGTLAQRLDCPVKELAMSTCFRIPKEEQGVMERAYEQARQVGERSFQAEYRIESDRGETAWVSNTAVQFKDKNGDTGYIHFLTETTQEHQLMDRIQKQLEERLKDSQHIFDIVSQHSNRTLYQYDLATRTTRPWNEEHAEKDVLRHLYTGVYSDEALAHNTGVLPDSMEDTKKFFQDIHSGVPFGEMTIHVRMQDGASRWYHFKYSSLFNEGTPVMAVISIADTTEQHEHELAYLRHAQEVLDNTEKCLIYAEACMNCDHVERLSGQILSDEEITANYAYSGFQTELLDKKFLFETPDEASRYFSSGHLLEEYAQGNRRLNSEWKVLFSGDITHWLGIDITLFQDPFNGHVKAFIRIMDITEAHKQREMLQEQADYDAMTGLLRRGVGELRIRAHLAEHKEPGGILIILDLDDLKGINDTLGHAFGDKAIKGIADTIKAHFRKDDILVRLGGDEFLVFLPGAGKGIGSVEASVASLLRKLSATSLGDQSGRTIHCSIGCAVELPETDTFDSLYQRADMALYHVKRSGKNSYAFFVPEMLEESYRFKVTQATPVIREQADQEEIQSLLKAVSMQYPGVVFFNLTQNRFRILTVGSNVDDVHAPDTIEVFWENWKENIHPDDLEATLFAMSRENLTALYARGKYHVQHYYRNKEALGYVRTELDVRICTTSSNDLCAFLFFRWDSGAREDMELQYLNKVLSELGERAFEYICLVDVATRQYSIFSNDGANSHFVPESADFAAATRSIRDTRIPSESRSDYDVNSSFERIMEQMETHGRYSYQYMMDDGVTREAAFYWYADGHTKFMMTVSKLEDGKPAHIPQN